ncbi:MAG: N-acetylmuramoyl-L-alanine amidase [Bacillota bacterium]|nr:N-acetylmuramoyl-L-alanine amidase [Bacillota bacterium]
MKKLAIAILIFFITGYFMFFYKPEEKIAVVINEEPITIEDTIKTEDDNLLVPAISFFDELGFETFWDETNNILSANLGDFRLVLPAGSREITVNGQSREWDVPVTMVEGIAYIPLRHATEAVGAFIEWNEQTRTVNISTLQEVFDPEKPDDQEGPLLFLAYPPTSPFTYYGHSLFVFGTTKSYSQVKVTVNGDPVEIIDNRTGNFLTMVDIPRGEEFPIVVEATGLEGTSTIERSVIYPAPWKPMHREPLAVHSTYLVPGENQVLKIGDTLTIAFQGSPGAEAHFRIGDNGSWNSMTELAYVGGPRGEGGIYTAVYKVEQKDLPASGSTRPKTITVSLRRGGNEVTRVLPGRVSFTADSPYKIIEIKKEHELKNRGWLYQMRESGLTLHSSTVGGNGHPTTVISYLVAGTRYEAEGMSGNYYRINLYGDQNYLIHKDMVNVLESKEFLEPSLNGLRLLETTGKVRLIFITDERFHFFIEDGKDNLAIKAYGLEIDQDLQIPDLTLKVEDLNLAPNHSEGPDSWTITINFDFNMTAFSRKWSGNNLIIDIYKPQKTVEENIFQDKTIIIDPGHGGRDTGAPGPGVIHEKDVNLAISLYLRDLLSAEGTNVIMTRTEDIFVNLYDRPEQIDQYDADIFVSVHSNAHAQDAPATEIHGIMVLYNYAHNEALAEIMLKTLDEEMELPAFRIWRRNIAVLRHPQIPSVLVEAGYMMHPEDNWYILHPLGQREFARAIKEGIKNYFLFTSMPSSIE